MHGRRQFVVWTVPLSGVTNATLVACYICQARLPSSFGINLLEILCIVYLIKSLTKDFLYTGSTSDLKRRFDEHNKKQNISTKFYAPFKLIYYEAYTNKSDALEREQMLKHKGASIGHLKNRIKRSLND